MTKINNNFKYKYLICNNTLAFSLIELSIVLIIIGLLVAGITGGASLIESAKIIQFTREIEEWQQSINSFYVLNRLPGDANNDGKIGYGSNEEYSENYFPSYEPFANDFVGPFLDLYLAKIIEFKPIFNRGTVNMYNLKAEGAFPVLQALKDDIFYYFAYMPTIYNSLGLYNNNYKDITSNVLILNGTATSSYNKRIKCLTNEKVDRKIDDGKMDSGSIRIACDYLTNYNECNTKTKCQNAIFKINL